MIDRLLCAIVEALGEDDPMVTIALGERHIEITWEEENRNV